MPTPNIDDFGVTFGGLDIVAIVLPFGTPAADLQVWRTQFAASIGISEIVGGTGGRIVEIPVVLRDTSFTTRIKLEDWSEEINDKIGTNDTMRVFTQDDSILPYDNCTFHGFGMTSDPKPDEAGTLGAGTGRWFCQGVLRFYQLLV